MANALAHKHNLTKAEFCICAALHYANLSHDIELINIVKTKRQSIKMDLKAYKESKERDLKMKSDRNTSNNLDKVDNSVHVDTSDNLDNLDNSNDSSGSGSSLLIGYIIFLILSGIAYLIVGNLGIIVFLFILYKLYK